MSVSLADALRSDEIETLVQTASEAAIVRTVATTMSPDTDVQGDTRRLPRLAYVYEVQGIRGYGRWLYQREGGPSVSMMVRHRAPRK